MTGKLDQTHRSAGLGRLALAALGGAIAMWALAGVWHKVVMAAFYTHEAGADHEGTGIILLAYLVLGALMAYLYALVRKGGRPLVEGLKFGVVIGLLWVFPHELAMAGAHGESIPYVLKNAAWHMVEQGVGGIVVGLIVGRAAVAAPRVAPQGVDR